ncbi:RNA polymerase factor sigma-54 [Campylobacter canadensis]|uniref:RNA polymerase factor sigma-54 n=1 Tax=Campylobacter canadensis TaxID=449520 RepID=A0ABS7WRC0_9BACT|nr:RNA polymerase factor sigma-54 [Campylobacter canadensis]MBZ7986540.1 RNA polymerase factor sigma-54 [Campylobacter canadensis]MBZ7997576.1 RNA polymerase factor sigma-54 [Campylobacter canadensis]
MLKQKVLISQKAKLSQTLQSWLNVLQASSEQLEEEIAKLANDNPFIKINANYKKSSFNSLDDNLCVDKKSLYDDLYLQINKSLFPTEKSQKIAELIITCLDENGYFVYDEDLCKDYLLSDIELVRKRFYLLEPMGVGAKDYCEALYFCLLNSDIKDELFVYCKKILNDFQNLSSYSKDTLFKEATSLFKSFSLPPFLNDYADSEQIIPDIYIYYENNELKVYINDEYYPHIEIDVSDDNLNKEFFKEHIKEAKKLVDSLELRKATLKKLALMLVEYQYEYFLGKDIKPMTLQDLALELDRNTSTISRAIANKYLCSNRGVIAIKEFFAKKIDDGISNKALKDYLLDLIKNENKKKPLSDEALVAILQEKFNIKLVRRTVTKYRKILDIPSSSTRKKMYFLNS